MKKNSFGTVLRRLEDRNPVRHKGDYWAIGDEEDVRRAFDFPPAMADLDDRFGAEALDE